MKQYKKRLLSVFLLLCLLLSLILPAVNAATGTLVKNDKARHITCTSLSSQAQAYYTAGTYDYATISAMHGVYSTDSWTVTQNNPIYTNLQRLMVDTHTNTSVVYSGTSNGSLAYYWNYTDTVNGGSNYLLFYCDKLMSEVQNTEGHGRTGMEREHVWCQSKASYDTATGSGGADLHHLRPSYGYVNGIKSNRAFGNVENGSPCTLDEETVFTYTGNDESGLLEVNDNIKGDIARILLYVYVRWGEPNLYTSYSNISQKLSTSGINTTGTLDSGGDDGTKIIDSLETLLEWMEIDPVDTWEMMRNDQVENVQGNRNVFIDYPEYAWMMFGMDVPDDMTTPSGIAINGYTPPVGNWKITNAAVNNPNYGSVTITGDNTVSVTLESNCYIANATASSGTANINGNIITVSDMTYDCTVTVILGKRYTVTLNNMGSISTSTCVAEDNITLPTPEDVQGYTFAGWVASPIQTETSDAPTEIYTDSFTPTANCTLYAAYYRTEEGGEAAEGYYKTADVPAADDKIIIGYKNENTWYGLKNSGEKSSACGAPTVENDQFISEEQGSAYVLTVGEDNTGTPYLTNGSTYLHINASDIKFASGYTGTNNGLFTIASEGEDSFSIMANKNSKYLIFSEADSYFRSGASATPVTIFKYSEGTTSTKFYTTNPSNPSCTHTNTILTGAVSATCTATGYTGDTVCQDCGTTISYGTEIPKTNHTSVSVTAVAATCETPGRTAGTKCSVCQTVLTGMTEIPAKGHDYVGTTTKAATCTVDGVKTYTCSRSGCGSSYTETIDRLGHNYSGAVTTAATCGKDGVMTHTCSRCKDSYTTDIPATGNHNYYSSITTQPTCTTAGVKTYTCYTCGDKYTETISATGHDYGSATSNNNPEFHTYYCQNYGCSSSYTEPHTFTESTSGYYRTFTCSGCGYSYSITLNTYVVTYNDQGVENRVSVIEGNSTTPPATASGADGFTFAGWSFTPVTEESTSVTLQTASFKPTGDVTLYAIYSREETNEEGTYTLVTDASQLTAGKNVIIAAKDYDYAMGAVLSNYYRDQAAITKNGSKAVITENVHTFTLSQQNGKWSLKDTADNSYLTAYVSGSFYDLGTETKLSDNGRFTVAIVDGKATLSTNSGCYVRYTRENGYEEFVCRSSASDDLDIALYIEAPASTTYYTSVPHPKETYTVSYSELGTVTDTASVLEGSSISLPDTATAASDYTFLGWVDAQIYNETTDEPVILTGSYMPTGSVTLYAAYMRTQPGEGPAASLVKMNTGDTLSNGDKIVVIANGTGNVLYQQTRSGSYVMYKDFSNDTLTARDVAGDDKYYFDVTVVDGGYKLGDATNGYLYNSSSNNLACSTENSSVFTLTDNEDGTFYLMIGNRWLTSRTDLTTSNANYYRLNTNTNGSYKLDLYKYTPGAVDILYYTTNPTGTEECAHPSTTLIDALAATCTEPGFSGSTVCDDCGITVAEGTEIAALGHDIIADAGFPATCTSAGLTDGEHCSRCDYAVAQESIPALGHSYISEVTTAATCAQDGVQTYTCSRCNDFYTEAIPALGHSYNENGICPDCSDKLISITSAYLRLDEDIDVIYTAKVPAGATASMTFTMNGSDVTVNDDGTHEFAFEGVNPQCMGDNISATLNVTYGGKSYSCTKASYSVKEYCTSMLSKSETSASLKKLLSDTLAYGAAAQTYMNYKTNALVTSGVTGTSYSTFSPLSGLAPTFTGTAAESPCWIGAGLTLTDDVAMVFRFASPNKTGLSVKVTYNGKTTTFSGTSITAVSGMSGVYEVKLEGIKATDFDEKVTAEFYKSSAQVGNTVSYSVNAYVCAKQADSDANLAALVKALYNYGASAEAYAK